MAYLTLFCSMLYFIKSPRWLQQLFPGRIWKFSSEIKNIYLTFDDGPHPLHTPFVLDLLKEYNAKATFFCIGNNVRQYPEVYDRIIREGHGTGNHTYNHLNGGKVNSETYVNDVLEAGKYIDSNLFRPPYGRIRSFQAKVLSQLSKPFKIIMWTVLSGDFDEGISKKRCLENVLFNTGGGSVIVFHDSDKAAEKMRYVLPIVIKTLSAKGFGFKKIMF